MNEPVYERSEIALFLAMLDRAKIAYRKFPAYYPRGTVVSFHGESWWTFNADGSLDSVDSTHDAKAISAEGGVVTIHYPGRTETWKGGTKVDTVSHPVDVPESERRTGQDRMVHPPAPLPDPGPAGDNSLTTKQKEWAEADAAKHNAKQ